jgi:hypothetical protein
MCEIGTIKNESKGAARVRRLRLGASHPQFLHILWSRGLRPSHRGLGRYPSTLRPLL